MAEQEHKLYTTIVYVNDKILCETDFFPLDEIDALTIKFNNYEELVENLKSKLKIQANAKNIKVEILYYANKKSKEKPKKIDILYKEHESILRKEETEKLFEYYCKDKNFILNYIKQYETVDKLKHLTNAIRAKIDNSHENIFELKVLISVLSSYKNYRRRYLYVKDYENELEKARVKPTTDSVNISVRPPVSHYKTGNPDLDKALTRGDNDTVYAYGDDAIRKMMSSVPDGPPELEKPKGLEDYEEKHRRR